MAACCGGCDDNLDVSSGCLKVLRGGNDTSRDYTAADGVCTFFPVNIATGSSVNLVIAIVVALTVAVAITFSVAVTIPGIAVIFFIISVAVAIAITITVTLAVPISVTIAVGIAITNSCLQNQRPSDRCRPTCRWCQSEA